MVLTKCLKCGKELPAGTKSCPDCDGPAPEELTPCTECPVMKGVGVEKWSYRKMAGKVTFVVVVVMGVLLLFALAGTLILFLATTE